MADANQDLISRTKAALAAHVLDAYKSEFADYSQWWRDLDLKAQGTVAIAGVVLTATAAFLTATDAPNSAMEAVVIALLVLLLLASLALAILALLVREVDAAPSGEDVDGLAREILELPEGELPERLNGIVYDHAEIWREAIDGHFDQCHAKSVLLRWAQIAILGAAVAISLVAWGRIVARVPIETQGVGHEMQLPRLHTERGRTREPLRDSPPEEDEAGDEAPPREEGIREEDDQTEEGGAQEGLEPAAQQGAAAIR